MDVTTHPSNPVRLPCLDGWRALSIGLVLACHSYVTPHAPGVVRFIAVHLASGDLGVKFFFIISGFLITWLLICEHEKTGRVNLRHFYIRRGLRIFPVYFAYLVVLGLLTSYKQDGLAWVGNLTFTTNFTGAPFTTGHLWSLAVEEQFYLLWPALFLMTGLGRNLRNTGLLLSVPILAAPFCRMVTYTSIQLPAVAAVFFQQQSFFFQFDALAMGCACAVLLAYKRSSLEGVRRGGGLVFILGTALILTPILFRHVGHVPCRLQAGFFSSMQAAGFSILLLQSVLLPGAFFYKVLNYRWITHLGVLSYSIYIWQEMFCGSSPAALGIKNVWWLDFPMWLLVALSAAHISHFCLERPFLKLRTLFREVVIQPKPGI